MHVHGSGPNGEVVVQLSGSIVEDAGDGNEVVKIKEETIVWQKPVDIQSVFAEIVASSTTTLAENATYTSATIDMQAGDNACSRLVVNFGSDQDGTLSLEGSLNGTDWHTIFTAQAGKSAEIDKRIALRYVRVVLKNGATAQGSNFIVATRMAL